MKKYIFSIITIIVLLPAFTFSQSLFGATDKTIGNLILPYSAAGSGRSYEIASLDTVEVNPQNFSLWTKLANTTYTVDAGYEGATAKDNDKNSYYSELFNFQGGYLGIPLKKKMLVLGIGLQPISNIDRRFIDTLKTETAETNNLYLKGGLGRGIINISYSPVESFGIGIGYEYTFGTIKENFVIEYEDVSYYRIGIKKESRFSGHGAVISGFIRPANNLTVGMFGRLPVNTRVDIERNSSSDFLNKSQKADITLPAQYGLGLEYQLKPRWSIGADLQYQDWENGYKIEDNTVSNYNDKFYRFGIGVERSQSKKRYTTLREQMDFRAGLFYGNISKTSNYNPVKEYGLSLGFSFPIIRYISVLDVSAQIGRRGSLNENTYQETFYSVGITFSASELWFVNYDD